MALPSVTGDHFLLAAEAGVIPVPARAPAQSPIFIGYKVPGETIYGRTSHRMWLPGTPHVIAVNRAGQRFSNDGFYPDVATRVARFDGQEKGLVNWPAWIIFDQTMLDRFGMLPSWPGQPLPAGMATSAASLATLASLVGIEPAGLEATVRRFNSFCETGTDLDFGRGSVPWGRLMTGDPGLPNPNLGKIETGPFHAVKLERVTMGVPTAGLPIDTTGRHVIRVITKGPETTTFRIAENVFAVGGNARQPLRSTVASTVMGGTLPAIVLLKSGSSVRCSRRKPPCSFSTSP